MYVNLVLRCTRVQQLPFDFTLRSCPITVSLLVHCARYKRPRLLELFQYQYLLRDSVRE